MRVFFRHLFWVFATIAGLLAAPASAGEQSPPAPETPWPYRVALEAGSSLEVYPPQLDSWDGMLLKARSAVVMRAGGATAAATDGQATYGVIEVEAHTLVDHGSRTVAFSHYAVSRAEFPSAGPEAQAWVDALQKDAAEKSRTISLDRLEAAVKESGIETATSKLPLRNDAPAFVFSTTPALLVTLQGLPRYTAVAGTDLERVMNTRVLLLKNAAGRHYLHVFDGWMTSAALQGNWTALAAETPDLARVRDEAEKSHAADLLTGVSAGSQRREQADKQAPPSLKRGPLPRIVVASTPTELIVTEGKWSWMPLKGTQLLYVSNTTGNIFRSMADRNLYVLASGRWFRSGSEAGPWTFVAGNALPADFAKIPDDSDKENVKASVAATPQAREAAIAATVPQTAAVPIAGTAMQPLRFDGGPMWTRVEGTALSFASNTPTPLIRINEHSYYALDNAVWFVASSTKGPWVVATSLPSVIYTIPPSSPLHYVTYVRIYGASENVVYVGYTSGYQGVFVDPATGVVVYGTGYVYDPWIGTTYIATQTTYGYAAATTYTPWTGWFVGFCFGWAWGASTSAWDWGWGPYPYWGPWTYGWGGWWGGAAFGPYGGAAVWGPGGWAGFSGPIYHRWGSAASVSRTVGGFNAWTGNEWAGRSGVAYNSRTGRVSAGQRGVVANVYTGNFATGSRGVTRGPGGVIAGGSRGTAGNAITGNTVSGNRGFVYNPATGQGTTYGNIRTDNGGIGHVGDDVYAGHDGNVYRNTGDGWQKHSSGGWQPVTLPSPPGNISGETRNTDLDRLSRDRQARTEGAWRDQQLQHSTDGMRDAFGGGRVGGRGGGFHGGRLRR